MQYITHLTLTTGHVARQQRADVSDEMLAVLVPWLRHALTSAAPQPVPQTEGYQARAVAQGGSLVVTVYAPTPDVGPALPLLTFGVAARSRHAPMLWELLTRQPCVQEGLRQPPAPWCGVVLYPALAGHLTATEWLGDFERCVAWAWVTRNPGLEAV